MGASNENWRGKYDELILVASAVDRELDDYTKRDTAMQSRATILIGAASVIGALQITDTTDWFTFAHLALSFVAALFGVFVVFPRSGEGFEPRTMWDEAYKGVSREELLHHAIRVKLENLEADEKSLRLRGKFVRVGFAFLAAGIVVATAGALAAAQLPSQTPNPSPTAQVFQHPKSEEMPLP
jgi:hypothetical protein